MKTCIRKPLITEKSMQMTSSGWYTFSADVSADKNKVKREIEDLYGVSVEEVRSSIMHGKTVRVGRKGMRVQKKDWKKVYVRVKAGQTIEAFHIGGPEEKK